jgi:uncharacterized protein
VSRMSSRFVDVALALGIATTSGCAAHQHGAGHGAHGDARAGLGLTVVGTGEAKAAPDSARTTIGIEVRNASAEQATAQANERMGAVIAAIKSVGITEADLRTSDFSISFEREFHPQPVVQIQTAPAKSGPAARGAAAAPAPPPPPPPPPPEPKGMYRVSNMVEVFIRDVGKTSQVLTAATEAGANNVWEVNFDIADREPLHARARAQAIARAKESAAHIAKLTGATLGPIVAIDDAPAVGGPVYAALRSEKAMASAPIEPGQRTVTHQVRLVYALE